MLNVDGNVFAQPLLASNVRMPDGKVHNVLIVATGHNSVYAYDAQTYAILWQVSLGTPQSTGDVGCGDVQPEYGISSTPVVVRHGAAATLYVVAATEPAAFSFHPAARARSGHRAGHVAAAGDRSHEIAARGGTLHFDPQNQWNRASLVYSKGSIYVGVGSHCDNNSANISGWLLAPSMTAEAKKPWQQSNAGTIMESRGRDRAALSSMKDEHRPERSLRHL